MTPIILLSVLVGLPVLNALLFRVNAVFLFASIAVGDLLVRFLGDDVILAVNAFNKSEQVPLIVNLSLLLVPVIMTLFMLRKSLPRAKIFLHLLPIIGCGLTIAVLAVGLLPEATQVMIFEDPIGDVFQNSQDLIIGVTAILVLLLALHSYKPHDEKHGKHGKH